MFVGIPSGDADNSLKVLYPDNKSRTTNNVHLSPKTSRQFAIGHGERIVFWLALFPVLIAEDISDKFVTFILKVTNVCCSHSHLHFKSDNIQLLTDASRLSIGAQKMSEITYKEIEANEIASVKGLCDSLMEYQAEMGEIRTDILAAMNFENRFVPDYHVALRKNVTVAVDDGVPVGFSFAAINDVTDEDVHSLPVWAGEMGGNGFYPEDYAVPKRVGTFKLLFVDPAYRGLDIGKHLSDKSMHWLRSHDDVDDLWVYVANGNERVGAFYEAYGFKFSHSVFNGFIRAYSQGAKD